MTQLSEDTSSLRAKADALADQHDRLQRRHTGEVEAARRTGVSAIRQEREQWVANEKERLGKLAASKEGQLKEDAAKALEPRLRDLISSHHAEVKRRRSDVTAAQEELEARLKSELAANLNRLRQTLDAETSAEVTRHREALTGDLRESMKAHEEELRRLRQDAHDAMAEDRSKRESDRRRRESALDQDLSQVRHARSAEPDFLGPCGSLPLPLPLTCPCPYPPPLPLAAFRSVTWASVATRKPWCLMHNAGPRP